MRALLIVLTLAGLGALGWQQYNAMASKKPQYLLGKAQTGDVVESVPVTGTAEPLEVRNVQAEVLGTVEQVFVDYNSEVKSGQLLARLSQDIAKAQLAEANSKLLTAEAAAPAAEAAIDQAQSAQDQADAGFQAAHAGLKSAQSDLSAALREYQTAKTNAEQGIVPQSKADSANDLVKKAQAKIEEMQSKIQEAESGRRRALAMANQAESGKLTARANIEAARAFLRVAELSFKKTDLVSNMDGIVLNKDIRVGDTVGRPRVSLTEGAGALFEIASSLEHMRAVVKVSEADYSRVRVGQEATFRVDAYPETEFKAKVVKIRYAPTSDRTAVSYSTELEFENKRDPSSKEWMVRPRSTISADIVIRVAKQVLTAPNSAMLFAPTDFDEEIPPVKETEKLLWRLGENGKPVPIKIVAGISDGLVTEVKSGDLKAGDDIIVGRPPTASAGFKLPFSN